jgi:hypothetical protein
MGAVRSYPSRELRRLRREWLSSRRRYVVLMGAFYVAVVMASSVLGVAFADRLGWYAMGLLHAGLAAMLLHLLNSAVMAHEPRAIFQMRGAWGEDNTRSELEGARKKKLVWGWVDSISLQSGDLDHVVVTRNGGVVVLDSKFRTEVTSTQIADMTRAAARARARAEALARTVLKSEPVGRRRASRTSITVTPCIVIWGPARHGVPDEHRVDGVHLIDGGRLKEWLHQLPPSPVSEDAAHDFLERLTDWRDRTAATLP